MYSDYLKDSIKIYTKEDFDRFVRSSETRCYLMTDSGRFECIKQNNPLYNISNYNISNVVLLNANTMRGFKAFHIDWTCRDKQYKVGETFKENIDMPIPCEKGMHFCADLVDVFYYYSYELDKTSIAEIEATGTITTLDGEKFCTNEMKIIREVYPEEILNSVRQSIYWKLITKLPSSVVADAVEKLRLVDKRILKFSWNN